MTTIRLPVCLLITEPLNYSCTNRSSCQFWIFSHSKRWRAAPKMPTMPPHAAARPVTAQAGLACPHPSTILIFKKWAPCCKTLLQSLVLMNITPVAPATIRRMRPSPRTTSLTTGAPFPFATHAEGHICGTPKQAGILWTGVSGG